MYYDYLNNKITRLISLIPEEKNKEFNSRQDSDQRKKSYIFLAYGMSEICNIDILEAISCITDGGGDAQIDGIYIQNEDNQDFAIHFFQSKYYHLNNKDKNIGENNIRLTLESIDVILNGGIPTKLSPILEDRIKDIKEAISDRGYPNIFIHFLSNGNIPNNEDIHILMERFDQYEIRFYGAKEIAKFSLTPPKKNIECLLTTIGDITANFVGGISGYIATVSAKSFVEMYNQYGKKDLLEKNIRYYKGLNTINKKIKATAESEDESQLFWFVNNGISLVCDGIAPPRGDGNGNKILKIKNPMIINGGQTTETLANSNIHENTRILVKIYVLTEDSIIAKITEGTNSQNPINFRDLQANNGTQRMIQKYFLDHKVFLEIKSGEIQNHKSQEFEVLKNDFLLQAYVSIYKNNPSDAKLSKMAVLRRYFKEVFEDLTNQQLPFELFRSYQIIKFVSQNNTEETFFVHALFCICYTMAKLEPNILKKDFNFDQNHKELLEIFISSLDIIRKIIKLKQNDLGSDYSHNYLFKSKEIKTQIDKKIIENQKIKI